MTKGDIEFDVPFRELGFHGVPHRETVLLQPTTNCLVHLTNWVGVEESSLNAVESNFISDLSGYSAG